MTGIPVVRTALWGPSGSGKSMMISTLPAAARAAGRSFNTLTPETADYYRKNQTDLNAYRTVDLTDSADALSMVLGPRPSRRLRRKAFPGRFVLDLLDVRGGVTRDVPAGSGSSGQLDARYRPRFRSYLETCDAIVFLIDPLRDLQVSRREMDSRDHHEQLIDQLRRGVAIDGRRLPHQVTIVVTMYDEPDVLSWLAEGGWLTQDDAVPRPPRVRDEHAAAAFEWFTRWPRQGDVREIHEAVLQQFDPANVSYAFVSSIGFRAGKLQNVDLSGPFSDWTNLDRVRGGRAQLLSRARPVNVLETFERLAGRVIRAGRNPVTTAEDLTATAERLAASAEPLTTGAERPAASAGSSVPGAGPVGDGGAGGRGDDDPAAG